MTDRQRRRIEIAVVLLLVAAVAYFFWIRSTTAPVTVRPQAGPVVAAG